MQSHADQRQQDPRHALTRGEHGDDLISPRHRAERKEHREQQPDRQRNHDDLRELREVKERNRLHRGLRLDEVRPDCR